MKSSSHRKTNNTRIYTVMYKTKLNSISSFYPFFFLQSLSYKISENFKSTNIKLIYILISNCYIILFGCVIICASVNWIICSVVCTGHFLFVCFHMLLYYHCIPSCVCVCLYSPFQLVFLLHWFHSLWFVLFASWMVRLRWVRMCLCLCLSFYAIILSFC